MKQRDDIRRLNNGLEAQLKAKGMIFNYPDVKSFRDALSKAGFYKEWREQVRRRGDGQAREVLRQAG